MTRDPTSISADGLSLFVHDALEQGFVDERDMDAFRLWTAKWCARMGLLSQAQLNRAMAVAKSSEQKRLVAVYVKFAARTNSPAKRAAKLAELGVTPSSMTHWARRYHGPGYLARCAPTSTAALVRDYLRRYPGSTRQELVAHAGIVPTSLPGTLHWGLRTGRLRRDRVNGGLWRWFCND